MPRVSERSMSRRPLRPVIPRRLYRRFFVGEARPESSDGSVTVLFVASPQNQPLLTGISSRVCKFASIVGDESDLLSISRRSQSCL